jgi:uncharacterized protein
MRKRILAVGLMVAASISAAPYMRAQADAAASQSAAPAAIPAEDQPTKEQLNQLFEEMRLKAQMEGAMKSVETMMQQQVSQQIRSAAATGGSNGKALSPEAQEAVEKMTQKYMNRALTLYPVNEMIDDMATLYQHHLNKADVDAMIAFYGSPAGQHLLDAQPEIMKEYMPLVQKRMEERTKILMAEMKKDMEQLTQSNGSGQHQ